MGLLLIVEDDQAILDGIAIALEDAGYSVLKASNGEEALAQLVGARIEHAFVALGGPPSPRGKTSNDPSSTAGRFSRRVPRARRALRHRRNR